jgi:hypothetical protein
MAAWSRRRAHAAKGEDNVRAWCVLLQLAPGSHECVVSATGDQHQAIFTPLHWVRIDFCPLAPAPRHEIVNADAVTCTLLLHEIARWR